MIKKTLIALCLTGAMQPAFAAGRGYLGLWFAALPASEKVQTGVVVKKVFAGSAAEQAGIKPGEIVTKINGVPVRDPETAVALASENAAGERIRLTVIDSGRQSNVLATLAADPPDGFAQIMTAKPKLPPKRHPQSHLPASSRHCLSSARTEPCRADDAAKH